MTSLVWGIIFTVILYIYSIAKSFGDEPMTGADALAKVFAALISRTCNFFVIYFIFKLLGLVR